MAVYGSPLLEASAIVYIVMISEQLLMIFLQQMEVFLSIVGVGRAVANCASTV